MKKRKIYINAYLYKNLGDDLFVKILTDRYNENFIGYSLVKYKKNIFNNFKLVSGFWVKLLRKLLKIMFKKSYIDSYYKKNSDMMVIIGGSLFVENNNDYKEYLEEKYLNYYKPFFLLGLNFGPYNTKEYKEYIKQKIFKNAQDVCFRDFKSYNQFPDLNNVRVESDIIFSLDTSNIVKTDRKRVIFSVMDCNHGIGEQYKKSYEEKIVEMIKYFVNNNYDVVLMSFCKNDGDEIAIKSVLKRCDNKTKKSISTYFYRGNIQEALNVLGDSQIIVGTRFHANMLGLLLNKSIIAIAYNEKTLNFLNDIKFGGICIKLQEIGEFDIEKVNMNDIMYKQDIKNVIESSKKQFAKLDEFLNENRE